MMIKRKLLQKKYSGFTMFELLLVMVVLGVLSTFAFVTGRSAVSKGRDTQRKSDVRNLSEALELFYSDYGFYPDADGSGRIGACPYDSVSGSGSFCDWGSDSFQDDNGTIYFNRMPDDPVNTQDYVYEATPDREGYVLYASFENDSDADSQSLGCTGGACNGYDFYVKSPNVELSDFGLPAPTASTTPSPTSSPTASPTSTPSPSPIPTLVITSTPSLILISPTTTPIFHTATPTGPIVF